MTFRFSKVRLGEVAQINPRRPELSRASNAPTTFVPMQAVNEKLGIIDKAESRAFDAVSKGYSYFQSGDVLFAKITPCMQNGKHAIAENLIDGIGFGSTEFHVLRPGHKILSEWLLHYLRQEDVLLAAQRSFTGSVGLQRVPDAYLQNLELSLPQIEDQRRSLSIVRQIVAESRQAIDAVEQQQICAAKLQSAVLREVFGESAPIDLATSSKTNGNWKRAHLLDLACLESGHTPSRRHPEWWGGNISWLSLPDIRKLHGKFVYETMENTNDAGIANSSARMLPVGTVCVSRTASIGFVTILGKRMSTSQDFCNWICDPDKLDPEFLMYAFMASRDALVELGSGAVHKTIYMPTIKSFHICAPEITEQRHIARTLRDRLATAESLTTGLKARLTDIERLPQRLLVATFGHA